MAFERDPPDWRALLGVLESHGVAYVVTGSGAALLLGIPLEPGDLDVTPALDEPNLVRLAAALEELGARQYADAPFGRWETGDDGEQRWAQFEPTAADRDARSRWRPDPENVESFDYLLETRHGSLDVVPSVAGTFDELRPRALAVDIDGREIWVESIADQLATLTVPRRAGDRGRVEALRALQRR